MAVSYPNKNLLTQEEKLVLDHLDRVDSEVQAFQKKTEWDTNCADWEGWRYGKIHGDEAPIFSANILGNMIERVVAGLGQIKPEFKVSSRNVYLAPASDVLTNTVRAILDESQFAASVERNADFGATYGFSGFNVGWDAEAENGRGDIRVVGVDPRRLGVDPALRDTKDSDTASYIYIDRPMTLDVIRAIWPGRGGLVKPDDDLSSYDSDAPRAYAPASGLGGIVRRVLTPFRKAYSPYPRAWIREYWFQSSGRDPKTAQPGYPNGRLIHRPVNQDLVLDDSPNPYWDGGWPITLWDWRCNPNTFAGLSDVDELKYLQESFMRLGNASVRGILLSSIGTILGERDALTNSEWEQIDNRAARILRYTRGRKLEFVPPTAAPEGHLRLAELCVNLMETLMSQPKASQGTREPGVIASSAVEGLQLVAEVLLRARARRLEYVIERIGQKVVSRVIQYYNSDRVLQYVDDTKQWIDYAFIRSELITPNKSKAERQEFFKNFSFKITPLSSLPINRVQRALMAQQLFAARLVDDEEVLKQAEYPDWRAVLERTKQKMATGQLPPPDQGKKKSNRSGSKLSMGAM